jgi:hypothetical protein
VSNAFLDFLQGKLNEDNLRMMNDILDRLKTQTHDSFTLNMNKCKEMSRIWQELKFQDGREKWKQYEKHIEWTIKHIPLLGNTFNADNLKNKKLVSTSKVE